MNENTETLSTTELIKKSIKGGILHIFTGTALANIIKAVPSILLPLVMIRAAFNQLAQVDNLIQYLILIDGLGMSQVILRYCSIAENDGQNKGYFRFALRFGLIVYAVIAVIITPMLFIGPIYGSWLNNVLFGSLFFTVLLQFIYNCVQYFLRANRDNKNYSRFTVLYAATMAAFPLMLAALFRLRFFFGGKYQYPGVIIGRYISYFVCLIIVYFLLRKMPVLKAETYKFTRNEKRGMISYAFWAMLANFCSQIIPVNEQFFVNQLINPATDAAAVYKFASILPNALQIGVNSVIIFVFPYFARNYRDGKWVWRNFKKMNGLLSLFMAAVSLLLILFTPQIISVYNKEYLNSATIAIMRILCVAFGINACLRIPVGNILAAIGEIRYNMIIAAGSAVLHAVIGTLLVLRFGIYGAAYGMCIVYLLSGLIGLFYLRHYCSKLQKQPGQ